MGNERPNQQLIDAAKQERLKIYKQLCELKDFTSTQELANLIYPNGPFSPSLFKTGGRPQNVYGDSLSNKLKKLEAEGLVESKKIAGVRLWKVKGN